MCADVPAATPFLSAEAQQVGQSSIKAPAAKEPLPAAASAAAAAGKAPKRAKRAKAPEAVVTSLAPKSFEAPSEAAGSQQETASGSTKPTEAVRATPAVASAAAKADSLPLSNGVSAASKGAVSAGAAGSKAQPSAAATTCVAGSKAQPAAAANTIAVGTTVQPAAAADTCASAGQPPAAPALLSAQAASKAAEISAAGPPVLQQGAPGPAPAGAASFQLEQPAGTAGKQIAPAAGPVLHGPGEADRPAGAGLPSADLLAAAAPAEASASKAAQQEGSKSASTAQEVDKITAASSPGKPQQPTVPAKTGVVSVPADSVHQQVQDVARLGTDFDPESSPTSVTDVKVRRIC